MSDEDNVIIFNQDPMPNLMAQIEKEIPEQYLKPIRFILGSAWRSQRMIRKRPLFSLSTQCPRLPQWDSEEQALVDSIRHILPPNFTFGKYLSTAICLITGRRADLWDFDPIFETAIPSIVTQSLFFQLNDPLCQNNFTQHLIITGMIQKMIFPIASYRLTDYSQLDERGKPAFVDTIDPIEISNFLGHPIPNSQAKFGMEFTNNVYISKYPTKREDHFWYKITVKSSLESNTEATVCYGDDISDGADPYGGYKWFNNIDGNCPPTLTANSKIPPPLEWLPKIILDENHIADFEGALTLCPSVSNGDIGVAKQNFMNFLSHHDAEFKSIMNNFIFDWLDPSGKLKQEDLKYDDFILLGCHPNCPGGPNCPYRLCNLNPCRSLMLYRIIDQGWGIIATDDIPLGTFIDFYAGDIFFDQSDEEMRKTQSLKLDEKYLFGIEFEDLSCITIDSSKKGNITRFINNSHPSSTNGQSPNCIALKVMSSLTSLAQIAFFAQRDIMKGEQLTFFYGSNYQKLFGEDNSGCQCSPCKLKRDKEFLRSLSGQIVSFHDQ